MTRMPLPILLSVCTVLLTGSVFTDALAQQCEPPDMRLQKRYADDVFLDRTNVRVHPAYKMGPDFCEVATPTFSLPSFATHFIQRNAEQSLVIAPGQSLARDYVDPALLTLANGDILLAFTEFGYPGTPDEVDSLGIDLPWGVPVGRPPKILLSRSSDDGATWSDTAEVATGFDWSGDFLNLSMVQTTSGRIVIVDDAASASRNSIFYSDDNGVSWESHESGDWDGLVRFLGPIDGALWLPLTNANGDSIDVFTSVDGLDWPETPTFQIPIPENGYDDVFLRGVLEITDVEWLVAIEATRGRYWQTTSTTETMFSRSTDGGTTWSTFEPLPTQGLKTFGGRLRVDDAGTLWYVFHDGYTQWWGCHKLHMTDIYYTTSEDGGRTWAPVTPYTRYPGADMFADVTFVGDQPLFAFTSTRFIPTPWGTDVDGFGLGRRFRQPRKGMVWIGPPGAMTELPGDLPPVAQFGPRQASTWGPWEEIPVQVEAYDETGVSSVTVKYSYAEYDGNNMYYLDRASAQEITLFDDGQHDDGEAGDGLWGATLPPQDLGVLIVFEAYVSDTDGNTVTSRGGPVPNTYLCGGAWADVYVEPVHSVGSLLLASRRRGYFGGQRVGAMYSNKPHAVMQWPGPLGDNYAWQAWPLLVVAADSFSGWTPVYNAVGDPIVEASLSDQDITHRGRATRGLGVDWTQRSFQWSAADRDDFVIVEYELTNTGESGHIDSIFVAVGLDPEVTMESDNFDDQVAYNSRSNVLYAYDSGVSCRDPGADIQCPGGYLGLALLTDDGSPSSAIFEDFFGCIWCGLSPTDVRVSGGVQPELLGDVPVPPTDYFMALFDGPYEVPVDSSVHVAFGFVMGEGLEDMLVNAATMRDLYQTELAVVSNETVVETPLDFALHQNYPNPFRSRTAISFVLPRSERVRLTLYDLLGKKAATVLDEDRKHGRHTITVEVANLASGMYAYRLEAGDYDETRMMTVLR